MKEKRLTRRHSQAERDPGKREANWRFRQTKGCRSGWQVSKPGFVINSKEFRTKSLFYSELMKVLRNYAMFIGYLQSLYLKPQVARDCLISSTTFSSLIADFPVVHFIRQACSLFSIGRRKRRERKRKRKPANPTTFLSQRARGSPGTPIRDSRYFRCSTGTVIDDKGKRVRNYSVGKLLHSPVLCNLNSIYDHARECATARYSSSS